LNPEENIFGKRRNSFSRDKNLTVGDPSILREKTEMNASFVSARRNTQRMDS
jgi:hypothetical protein